MHTFDCFRIASNTPTVTFCTASQCTEEFMAFTPDPGLTLTQVLIKISQITPMTWGDVRGGVCVWILKSHVFCCEQALSYSVKKGATEHFTKAAFPVLLFFKHSEARRKKDTASKEKVSCTRSPTHIIVMQGIQKRCKAYKSFV